jgi:hypothetical protein
MKETRSEMIHARITPAAKEILKRLAKMDGVTVSRLINSWIFNISNVHLAHFAKKLAINDAIKLAGLPPELSKGIDKPEALEPILNKIVYEKFIQAFNDSLQKHTAELRKIVMPEN